MLGRLDSDISLGVIALLVLLLAGGVVMVNKANKNKRSRNVLPPAHRQLSALPIGAARTAVAPHGFRGPCHSCHPVANVPPAAQAMGKSLPDKSSHANAPVPAWLFRPSARGPWGGTWPLTGNQQSIGPFADTRRAAFSVLQGSGGGGGLLTPGEQNAADKIVVEGHWLGMETVDLTPALRRIYRIPADVAGVIVDEITLESAESGILAGDVITRIQERQTRNLDEFLQATQTVGQRKKAEVVVNRMGMERHFTLVAKNAETLGFAQMEGAQPIRPGALSPHRKRNRACTDCHVIMASGGQLAVDAGDILPTPPPIAPNAKAPHAYRGVCNSCHVIKTIGG